MSLAPAGALRNGLVLTLASATYGFAIGASHSWQFGVRNLAKLPLLLLATGAICGTAYFVVARFFAAKLTFFEIQRLSFRTFRDLAVLLASLSPASFFLGQTVVQPDEEGLGEYQLFLGSNMLFVALAGSLVLVLQARALLQRARLGTRRVITVVLCWLALSLAVGGQGAFYLRPIFGISSLYGEAPFALGSTPSATGARNFFEVVYQLADPPDLEPGYNRRGWR